RSGEFAIRMALGASQTRLAYQLITESMLLSLGGGILGLAIAKWAVIPSLAAVLASLPLFWAGPEYLKTMEMPLLRGRFLTPEDSLQSEPVIVIDSVLAQTYFHDKDPVGQTITIRLWGPVRIVGVVGHVRLADDENRVRNQGYASIYQLPDEWVPLMYPDLTMA